MRSWGAMDIESSLCALDEVVSAPAFKEFQQYFVESHCHLFDNVEENKLEYTELHKQYGTKLGLAPIQLFLYRLLRCWGASRGSLRHPTYLEVRSADRNVLRAAARAVPGLLDGSADGGATCVPGVARAHSFVSGTSSGRS